MNKSFNDALSSMRDSFVSMTLKANDLTKVGRLKIDVAAIKHSISKLFEELGERVYQLSTADQQSPIAADAVVQAMVNRIRELQTLLQEKRQQANDIFYNAVLNESKPGAAPETTSSSFSSAATAADNPSPSTVTNNAASPTTRSTNAERKPRQNAAPDFDAEAAGEGLDK